MRLSITTIVAALLLPCSVNAQVQKFGPVQHPAYSPGPLESPVPQQQPGYYASPPPNGTFAGPARSVGIDGFALHFPAMSLRLPTLQFPSFFKTRSQAKVLMDAAQAPFVEQQQPIAVGSPVAIQAVVPAATPQEGEPENNPLQTPSQKDSFQKGAYTNSEHDDEIVALQQQVFILAQAMGKLTEVVQRSEQLANAATRSPSVQASAVAPERLPVTNTYRAETQAVHYQQSIPGHYAPPRIEPLPSTLQVAPRRLPRTIESP
ncbi:MAG: hypothetical protein H6821_13820 [Planctomycetaceae bacterium]|nr:hypothetical protein [Planctomycetaceae bacterium]